MEELIKFYYLIRKKLIEFKVILPKVNFNFDDKVLKIENEIIEFNDVKNVERIYKYKHNYSFTFFLILFILGFIAALIYNIYTINNTFTEMSDKQFMLFSQLCKLRDCEVSKFSQTYTYNSMFLLWGPLFNGLVLGMIFGLIGRFIPKLRFQYIINLTNNEEYRIYPSKADIEILREYIF